MVKRRTDLADFPRPSLAADVAVLTVVDDQLSMVLWRRSGRTETGRWALPGSFVRAGERLADTVARTLDTKCAITGLAPTQLNVMDDPNRDARGWVVSVAHLDVVAPADLAQLPADGPVVLAPVHLSRAAAPDSVLILPDGQERLPFDHEEIAALAIERLRAAYRERPDPYGLLGPAFTVLQLRRLHEAVAGADLQKDTFRRTMLPFLEPLDDTAEGTIGRPARRYRRAH